MPQTRQVYGAVSSKTDLKHVFWPSAATQPARYKSALQNVR